MAVNQDPVGIAGEDLGGVASFNSRAEHFQARGTNAGFDVGVVATTVELKKSASASER